MEESREEDPVVRSVVPDGTEEVADPPGRLRALLLLAAAMLLAMSTWFSASSVVPQLTAVWGLGPSGAAWMTIAVQLGFVVGALLSAGLSLTDTFAPRTVMAAGAFLAASANLALLAVDSPSGAILWRLVTGMALAGVYPPAMKAMATWYRAGRGLALGTMVGALTLGSALPHLVRSVGGVDWRIVVVTTSLTTVLGGGLALVGRDGPFVFPRAGFDPRAAVRVMRDRRVRLASYGYFGHMWELYAMWSWIGGFLLASFQRAGVADADRRAAVAAFLVIGVGAVGAIAGGAWSDRVGRPLAAGLALLGSGVAATLIGTTFGASPWLVLAVALVWGVTVIADSALFSTIVADVADQRYVGTAVTLQLALGFTLTVVTIWLVPLLVDAVGWSWAFLIVVPGPVVGLAAMRALHREDARLRATTGT
jgi:MFS family permease